MLAILITLIENSQMLFFASALGINFRDMKSTFQLQKHSNIH